MESNDKESEVTVGHWEGTILDLVDLNRLMTMLEEKNSWDAYFEALLLKVTWLGA